MEEWEGTGGRECEVPIATEQRAEGTRVKPVLPPGLPADTLQGHRDRFHEQFHRYQWGGAARRGLAPWAWLPRDVLHLSPQPQELLPQSLGHALLQAAHPDPSTARGTSQAAAPVPPLAPVPFDAPGCLAGPQVDSGGSRGKTPWGATEQLPPWPPQGPPNFLRASALAEHIKPVVVIPEETAEDEEPENLIEIGTGPPAGEPAVSGPSPWLGLAGPPSRPPLAWSGGHHVSLWQVVADLFEQTFGPPNGSMKDDR